MDDYARATGAARTVTIQGKDYRVGKLTPRGLGDIQAFLKDAVPDPRKEARKLMDGLPEAVQIHIWNQATEAAKSWPPDLESAEGTQLILSPEGQATLLWVLLRQHNAGFTLETARAISKDYEMTMDELQHLMELASPGEIGDPKSPTTAPESP